MSNTNKKKTFSIDFLLKSNNSEDLSRCLYALMDSKVPINLDKNAINNYLNHYKNGCCIHIFYNHRSSGTRNVTIILTSLQSYATYLPISSRVYDSIEQLLNSNAAVFL